MLVMAIGAALQAAVGLGMALFVVPLLALIDVRLIPGPVLLASVALAVMMAYRGRAAINRRELTLSLVGLCMGTAVGAWGLSLVAPASLTKLFALLILVAVLVSLIGTGVRVSRGALLAVGGAAGVMGTMVGIHGPPIALVFQNAEPAQARAMLGAFFAVGLCDVRHSLVRSRPIRPTGARVRSAIAARRRHRLRDSTISRSFRGPQTASHRHPDHLRRKR
jgi:uncharacterized membrane protein YfcA